MNDIPLAESPWNGVLKRSSRQGGMIGFVGSPLRISEIDLLCG
jgi:hypothetical protein